MKLPRILFISGVVLLILFFSILEDLEVLALGFGSLGLVLCTTSVVLLMARTAPRLSKFLFAVGSTLLIPVVLSTVGGLAFFGFRSLFRYFAPLYYGGTVLGAIFLAAGAIIWAKSARSLKGDMQPLFSHKSKIYIILASVVVVVAAYVLITQKIIYVPENCYGAGERHMKMILDDVGGYVYERTVCDSILSLGFWQRAVQNYGYLPVGPLRLDYTTPNYGIPFAVLFLWIVGALVWAKRKRKMEGVHLERIFKFIFSGVGANVILILFLGFGFYAHSIIFLIKKDIPPTYAVDYTDDRVLMGASHHVFLGTVIKKTGSELGIGDVPSSLFEIDVLANIKGKLRDMVIVRQKGGYKFGLIYSVPGQAEIQSGRIYFFATRYNKENDWHEIIEIPYASRALEPELYARNNRDNLKDAVVRDEYVKKYINAYPSEILLDADVKASSSLNSYQSLPPEERPQWPEPSWPAPCRMGPPPIPSPSNDDLPLCPPEQRSENGAVPPPSPPPSPPSLR